MVSKTKTMALMAEVAQLRQKADILEERLANIVLHPALSPAKRMVHAKFLIGCGWRYCGIVAAGGNETSIRFCKHKEDLNVVDKATIEKWDLYH